MFTNKYKLSIFIFFILALFLTSCVDDNEEEDTREYFAGTWKCKEINTGFAYNVIIKIDSTTQTYIKLYNFHQFGSNEKVSAIVSDLAIDIPSQLTCNNTINVRGSGVMQNNKTTINLDYYVNDGSTLDTITAVYTKYIKFVYLKKNISLQIIFKRSFMYWTLELASKLEDAPWPATKEELLDYAYRTGAPAELIQNLLEIEDEEKEFEGIDDLWPDYPDFKEFFDEEEQ